MEPALFRFCPDWKKLFPFVSLIKSATPVHKISATKRWGITGPEVFVKREDLTDSLYGGNKVRNLEFILGNAVDQQASELETVAPMGSNFVAALAAQSKKLGLRTTVEHFIPVVTPQIQVHMEFSRMMGCNLRFFRGRMGAIPAGAMAFGRALAPRTHFISPGGSSSTGALGHVNAVLELSEQVRRGEVPMPDTIFVGVGTCGTIAGLSVGLKLLGWKTRIVGVRCVDKIVCHSRKIAQLANQTLKRLGRNERFYARDFTLIDLARSSYGVPLSEFDEIQDEINSDEIILDTTYTGKVVAKLRQSLREKMDLGRHVLYWHTFSSAAYRLADKPVTGRGRAALML